MDIDESSSDEEDERIAVVISGLMPVYAYIKAHYAKEECRTSLLTGSMYYQKLTRSRSPVRFFEVNRMSIHTFKLLLAELETAQMLPTTNHVSSGERLLIFLYILTGKSNREAQERWQHGPGTISRVVQQGIAAINACWNRIVVLPTSHTPVQIRDSTKFFPYFKDCIGALDGTHIPVIPPSDITPRFRNRKGFCSTNVLGVCNFSMEFLYDLAGWEGSAHDARVLKDALRHGFMIPQGKYYLGDAGYALDKYTMTPYRGVRYHLNEFGAGILQPQNKEGLFNLRHSSLRNVIERTYGAVKNKFPILRTMTCYRLSDQIGLTRAAFAIHNFIRLNHDQYADTQVETEAYASSAEEADAGDTEPVDHHDDEMRMRRDDIATAMWVNYLRTKAGRDGEVVV